MVPKIVAKGRSFKGAAAYLLHDKGRAETSERVEWVETRNLATQNPELAWRIMVSTALDQDRLKDAAGVAKTGRKSVQAALHMVLSWHPDEKDKLTREEMRRAAIAALQAIGADDRQVMLIAHNDEEHAHLHILCNRVSPHDGRMLSSSKDRLKLSKWAQGYEMERGQVYCENRVVNNERRAQGEFVADNTDLPYHKKAEQTLAPGDDRRRAFDMLKTVQVAKDRMLIERGADLARNAKEQWNTLSERLNKARQKIRQKTRAEFAKARAEIGNRYAPLRHEQNSRHRQERERFEEREAQLLGRVANTLKAVDHVRRIREEDPSLRLGRGFKVLSSAGARREALEKLQAQEKADLNRQQARDTEQAKKHLLAGARADRQKALSAYETSRLLLVARQDHDGDKLKEAWRQRTQERRAVFAAFNAAHALPYDLGSEFRNAASSGSEKRKKEDSGGMEALLDEIDRKYGDAEHDSAEAPDHDDDYEY